ncbi:MAG: helix-turn-helix domain-containing protein, partial [Bacteroidota bacterium]
MAKMIRSSLSGNGILDRLQGSLRIPEKRGKESRLAEALGISTSCLANWRDRDGVGFDIVVELCREHDLDLNYILLGRTPSTPVVTHVKEPELIASDIPTDTIIELGELGKRINEISLLLVEQPPPYRVRKSPAKA